jgi:hypothetical protein
MAKPRDKERQAVQCQGCFRLFWKEHTHLSFAGYRYCQTCWSNIGLREKLLKR